MIDENLKDEFEDIFKRFITPLFIAKGFKRKAHSFARQINDVTQMVHVQKSRENIFSNSQSFTFIFGFYNREISRIALGQDLVSKFPKRTDSFIESCLGVTTHGQEHWYKLNKEVDKNNLALKIKTDLTELLFPLFDKYNSLINLIGFIERYYKRKIFPSPYSIIVFYMETNQREKGVAAIRDNYAFAKSPQIIQHSIMTPSAQPVDTPKTEYINQSYIDKIEELAKLYKFIL